MVMKIWDSTYRRMNYYTVCGERIGQTRQLRRWCLMPSRSRRGGLTWTGWSTRSLVVSLSAAMTSTTTVHWTPPPHLAAAVDVVVAGRVTIPLQRRYHRHQSRDVCHLACPVCRWKHLMPVYRGPCQPCLLVRRQPWQEVAAHQSCYSLECRHSSSFSNYIATSPYPVSAFAYFLHTYYIHDYIYKENL